MALEPEPLRRPLERPSKQSGADGKTGTDRSNQHEIAFFESALLAGGFEPKRNRSRRCVAVLVDIDEYLFFPQPQPFCG